MTIFGYTWDEIKRAQQGGALARRIPAGIYKPLATDGDWELLERYGEAELRNRNYFGVLDRLENTRMANDMPDCDRSACRDHSLRACDNHDCPSLRPNALGEGRERGILREASSGEAATSTDGLEGKGRSDAG